MNVILGSNFRTYNKKLVAGVRCCNRFVFRDLSPAYRDAHCDKTPRNFFPPPRF